MYRYHGLHDDIVSDNFISKFWRFFFEKPKVDIKLSSALYRQTDGQTERVNQILEQYLQCSINYQQNDWTAYLPLAEFAYNNIFHVLTQSMLFFSNCGYHLKLDLLSLSTNNNPVVEGCEATIRASDVAEPSTTIRPTRHPRIIFGMMHMLSRLEIKCRFTNKISRWSDYVISWTTVNWDHLSFISKSIS